MTGTDPVDLLVKGTLVDVNTGRLADRTVAVDDGEIVGFGARPAARTIETEYLTPGLIDAHMHVEASMVPIPQYGNAVVPHGVTAVVHDPHEIANVLGADGVREFCADADRTPMKARMTVPSSVPASGLQDTGGVLDSAAVAELLDSEAAIALGEVMHLDGVLAGDDEIHEKIASARERGLQVDGHMPGVSGPDLHDLARYLDNDHESVELAEARAKVDAGLHVYLREGSTSKNLESLVDIVEAVDTRRLSLCTDERNVVDLVERGGINAALRKAMKLGVDPVTAVQMATLNTAEMYDLPFGRIEPGAPADMVLLSDLESWDVEHVIVDGVVDPTAEEGAPTESWQLLDRLEGGGMSEVRNWLRTFPVDENSVRAIARMFREQVAYAGADSVATPDRLVVEEALDHDEYERHYHVHSNYGRRFNDGFSRLLAYHIAQAASANVQVAVADNGFTLSMPLNRKVDISRIVRDLDPETAREDLRASLDGTDLLQRYFRINATRSLMILKRYKGTEKSASQQQVSSEMLLGFAEDLADFAVIEETYREILEDKLDVGAIEDVLGDVQAGDLTVHHHRVDSPTPRSFGLATLMASDVVLAEDESQVLQEFHQRVLSDIGDDDTPEALAGTE